MYSADRKNAKLKLDRMVSSTSDPMETAFTVSVDFRGNDVTTGISAEDRSKTIRALIDKKTRAIDLTRPGRISFNCQARRGFTSYWTYRSRN